jgi:DNA polymerase-1
MCNRSKYKNGNFSSKYKGATRIRGKKLWKAHITVNHRTIFLGSFQDEIDAAKAYDRAAKKYHGAFASTNFPQSKRLPLHCITNLFRSLHNYLTYLSSRFAALNFAQPKPSISRRVIAFTLTLLFYIRLHLSSSIKKPASRIEYSLTAQAPVRKLTDMAKKLYIIDGHAHIYAAYFAPMRPLTSPTGEATKATYIFTAAVLGLIQRHKPDMLVVALDSKAPTFRREIYTEYKANRPPMPDEMPAQIDRIEQILEAMNIPILRLDGFEADDIIGTLAKMAAKKGVETYICTKDKDMYQLVDEHTYIFDIKKGEVLDDDTLFEKYKIHPKDFIDVLALQGDSSDNVPGVPLIGEMNAVKMIQQYGSLDKLYEHADEIKGKRGENLRNFKEQAYLSKELVTIDCKIPIKIDYKALAMEKFNEPELAQIFTELGFTRLLTQLGLSPTSDTQQTTHRVSSTELPASGIENRALTVDHDYKLIDTQKKFDTFLARLKKQKLFAIDTETTSLNAMRADLVGISFSWQPHKAFYLPIKALMGTKHLDLAAVRRKLAPILADESVKKIGQNIKYDLHILQNAGLPVKGIHFDTMVASYCLDPSRSHSMDNMALDFLNYECIPISALIGKGKNQLTFDMVDTATACEYAAEDADITFQLYTYLKDRLEKEPLLRKLFEDMEMPLVSVLAAMEYNGVSLDTALLRKMSGEITKALETLTDTIYEHAGQTFNIDSPKQLSGILFDNLGLTPVRIGKTGRSTDAAVLEQLRHEHPVIEQILQYRMLTKLQSTYVDKLGSLINPRTDRVHASFNQTVTATGRLSSSDPNLQNIPIRTELGRKVRSAFIPKNKRDCILSADYSQVELRLLAHFSKDKALTAAFAEDRDIHRFVASQIFEVPLEEVTDEMRSRCKAVNFGIIYGQGAFGLSRSIGIGQAEAKQFIDDYFTRYSSIGKFMDECVEKTKQAGYAETILHRRRNIANLASKNANKRAQARRLAVNTVIQGSAADLIKVAMISIQKKIENEDLPVKLILQVHDELVFELPASEAEEHAKWIEKEMAGAIKLDVSLKVDISFGPTWLADK